MEEREAGVDTEREREGERKGGGERERETIWKSVKQEFIERERER